MPFSIVPEINHNYKNADPFLPITLVFDFHEVLGLLCDMWSTGKGLGSTTCTKSVGNLWN